MSVTNLTSMVKLSVSHHASDTVSPEERLTQLAIELPAPANPGFDYVPLTIHNDTLYLSGQIAKIEGAVRTRGKVGRDVTLAQAKAEMHICALQGLAWLRDELGSLASFQASLPSCLVRRLCQQLFPLPCRRFALECRSVWQNADTDYLRAHACRQGGAGVHHQCT